jgi:hypothetical protein
VTVPDGDGVLLEDADDESELIELTVELNPEDTVYESRADAVELSFDVEDMLNPVDAV